MATEGKEKTAFVTPSGLYNFNVMPFGVTNAPATFQRLMQSVLAGLQWDECLIYLDDIVVFGRTKQEHRERLRHVLQRLAAANLKLTPKKGFFHCKSINYLGYIVSEGGISTDPEKTKIISHWPVPTRVTDLRSFLSFAGYYRRFIPGFARLAEPLYRLTSKNARYDWSGVHERASETLKAAFNDLPVLSFPDFRCNTEFIVDTDASGTAIGCVLSQMVDDAERPIESLSKVLTKTQRQNCTTFRELLAVVEFVKELRPYLVDRHFILRTDHAFLQWLRNFNDAAGQLARWQSLLMPYAYTVVQRAGSQHGNADGLSRRRIHECPHCSSAPATETVNAVLCESLAGLLEVQEADLFPMNLKRHLEADATLPEQYTGALSRRSQLLLNQWPQLLICGDLICREKRGLFKQSFHRDMCG